MPRKKLIRSEFLPYHVTARANNREIFHLDPDRMWNVLNDELLLATIVFGIEIHAFVMMPNHFHLLLTTPNEDLGKVMSCILSYVTRTANLISGRSGRVFGARYHWSLMNEGTYYGHALKYVYRNPVKAQLSASVEEYRFSTIFGISGAGPLLVPLHHPRCGHGLSFTTNELDSMLSWLNRPFSNEIDVAIKRGFRRSVFEMPVNRTSRKSMHAVDGGS